MRTPRACQPRLLIAVLACAAAPASTAAQQGVPRLEPRSCNSSVPRGVYEQVVRKCHFLVVAETRGQSNGHTYRIAVVVYPAQQPDGSPPLLLLHGGPGGVGGTRFPWSEMSFPLARRRDVVVFDMRGVGASEPRLCADFEKQADPAFDRATYKEWEDAFRSAARECVAALDSQGIDRNAFGADISAADAIDLRHALGYKQWDIYGVSYGGQVVQELLRRDPQGTHAAVLVSTVPPGPVYASEFNGYQKFIERVFAGCAAQPGCRSAYPTLEADFYTLYDEFSRHPVQVAVTTASPQKTLLINGDRYLMSVRRHFNVDAVPRLPALINELRRGDRDVALRLLVANGHIGAWDALSHLVGCNEYGTKYRASVAALKSKLRPAFHNVVDDFREHCDIWLPQTTHALDEQPIASAVPALVVHGEYDPMDVALFQQRIAAGFTNAHVYVFPGEGHANPPIGCHGKVVQQFLEQPGRAPDSSCLKTMRTVRFKTTLQPTLTFDITPADNAATPFAGMWEADFGGQRDWNLALEIKGQTVAGGVTMPSAPIYDGVIHGDTLSFKLKSPGGARVIKFTAILQNNQLAVARDVEAITETSGGPGIFGSMGPRAFVMKRVR